MPAQRVGRFAWERAFRGAEGLTPTDKCIGLFASTYASRNGGDIWPGAERLARDTGVSKLTALRSLKKLRESGWLARVHHANGRQSAGGGRLADVYALSVPAHVKLPATAEEGEEAANSPVIVGSLVPRQLAGTWSGFDAPF